jgi:hypothetical protein
MKVDLYDEFDAWYLGKMPDMNKTREGLAFQLGINKNDLFWAFTAGWNSRYETLTTSDI